MERSSRRSTRATSSAASASGSHVRGSSAGPRAGPLHAPERRADPHDIFRNKCAVSDEFLAVEDEAEARFARLCAARRAAPAPAAPTDSNADAASAEESAWNHVMPVAAVWTQSAPTHELGALGVPLQPTPVLFTLRDAIVKASIVIELRLSPDWIVTVHSAVGAVVGRPLQPGVRPHAAPAFGIRRDGLPVHSWGALLGLLSDVRHRMLICRGFADATEIRATRDVDWLDRALERETVLQAGGDGGVRKTFHAPDCRGYAVLARGSGRFTFRSAKCVALRKALITDNRQRRRESQEESQRTTADDSSSASSASSAGASTDDDASESEDGASSVALVRSRIAPALYDIYSTVITLHDELNDALRAMHGLDALCGAHLAAAIGARATSRRAATSVSTADATIDARIDTDARNVRLLSLLCNLRHLLGHHGHLFDCNRARSIEPTVLHLGARLYERLNKAPYLATYSILSTFALPSRSTARRVVGAQPALVWHVSSFSRYGAIYIRKLSESLAGRVSLDTVRLLSRVLVIYYDASVARECLTRTHVMRGELSGAAVVPPATELFKSVDAATHEYGAGQLTAFSAASPFFPSLRGIVVTMPTSRADNDAAMYSYLIESTVTRLVACGWLPLVFGSDGDFTQRQQQKFAEARFGLDEVQRAVAQCDVRVDEGDAPERFPRHRRTQVSLYDATLERLRARLAASGAHDDERTAPVADGMVIGAGAADSDDGDECGEVGSDLDDDVIDALLDMSDDSADSDADRDDDNSETTDQSLSSLSGHSSVGDGSSESDHDESGSDGASAATAAPNMVSDSGASDSPRPLLPVRELLRALGSQSHAPSAFHYLHLSDPTHVCKNVHKSLAKEWAMRPPPPSEISGMSADDECWRTWRIENSVSLAPFTAAVRAASARAYEANAEDGRSGIATCIPWLSERLLSATVIDGSSFSAMRVGPVVALCSQAWLATIAEPAIVSDAEVARHRGTLKLVLHLAVIVTFWHTTEGVSKSEWHNFWRAKFQAALDEFASASLAWESFSAAKSPLPAGVRQPPRGLLRSLARLCEQTIVVFDVLFALCDEANALHCLDDEEAEFEANIVPMVLTQNRLERFFGAMRGGRGGKPISHWASSAYADSINRFLAEARNFKAHKQRQRAQRDAVAAHVSSILKAARLQHIELTHDQLETIVDDE